MKEKIKDNLNLKTPALWDSNFLNNQILFKF